MTMSAAAKMAENLLQIYKNVLAIQKEHKKCKVEAWKRQYPSYKLFDFEHPYHDMTKTTDASVKQIKQTIKSMMDVEIDGSNLRREWEKDKVIAYLSNKHIDQIVGKILKW
jgi:hypothetical protein